MSKSAYDRAMELKLAKRQAEQRAMSPQKVGQLLLREWLGSHGVGGVIDPMLAADLVRRVESAIKAERAASSVPNHHADGAHFQTVIVP